MNWTVQLLAGVAPAIQGRSVVEYLPFAAIFIAALAAFVRAEPIARRMRRHDGGRLNRRSPEWGDGLSAYVLFVRMCAMMMMVMTGMILCVAIYRLSHH